MIEQFKEFMDA
jgi:hypothetical protein